VEIVLYEAKRDRDLIAAGNTEAFSESFPGLSVNQESVAAWVPPLSGEDGATFTAVTDGVPVGFVTVTRMWFLHVPQASVDAIYVSPDHRRKGVATALMRVATDWAKVHGALCLRLDVSIENESARAFYEQLRFVITRLEMEQWL